MRDFGRALDALGPRPTAETVREAAPGLDEPLARAELVAGRLSSATLADTRLDAQRMEVAAAYGTVAERMDHVVDAAKEGRVTRVAIAAASYQEAVDALRDQAGAEPGP